MSWSAAFHTRARAERALVRLRRLSPVALFLPGFTVGQVLGWVLLDLVFVCSALVLMGVSLRWRRAWLVVFPLSLLAGMLSTVPDGIYARTLTPNSDLMVTVRVEAMPRYPEPGAVQLALRILDAESEETSETTPSAGPRGALMLCRAIDLPWRELAAVHDGDTRVMRVTITPIELRPALLSYHAMLRRHGYAATCKILASTRALGREEPLLSTLRRRLERFVRQRVGDTERAGLILSMVFGSRDELSKQTERAFKESGIAHLLVVSGYQVTLAAASAAALAWWLIGSLCPALILYLPLQYLSRAIGLSAAMLFVGTAGVESSSMRALIAIIVGGLFALRDQRGRQFHLIAICALIVNVLVPWSFVEPGFQLTFAALLGLYWGASVAALGSPWIRATGAALGASITTSLVSFFWFDSLSLIALPVNITSAALVSIVSCNGGLIALFAALSGLDPHGIGLQFVGYLLGHFRDLIVLIAEWTYEQTVGLSESWIGALVLLEHLLAVLIVAVLSYRISVYPDENRLH